MVPLSVVDGHVLQVAHEHVVSGVGEEGHQHPGVVRLHQDALADWLVGGSEGKCMEMSER